MGEVRETGNGGNTPPVIHSPLESQPGFCGGVRRVRKGGGGMKSHSVNNEGRWLCTTTFWSVNTTSPDLPLEEVHMQVEV